MRFKAIIFDLDGTLLDTLDDLADSMNAVLSGFGANDHISIGFFYHLRHRPAVIDGNLEIITYQAGQDKKPIRQAGSISGVVIKMAVFFLGHRKPAEIN